MEKGMVPLHLVTYLSMKDTRADSHQTSDIKYQFPVVSSKFVDVRGMLLTFSQTFREMTKEDLMSANMELHGLLYNAAFCQDPGETDVLILVLPDYIVTELICVEILQQMAKLIRFEFSSLTACFLDPGGKEYLDTLFLLVLENVFTMGGEATSKVLRRTNESYTAAMAKLIFGLPAKLLLNDDYVTMQVELGKYFGSEL